MQDYLHFYNKNKSHKLNKIFKIFKKLMINLIKSKKMKILINKKQLKVNILY